MNKDLDKLLKQERKHKRELAELRALRQKQATYMTPDPKILKMIDDEIDQYLKGTHK